MSFPEQADFSAERTNEPNVFDELTAERETAGSVAAFLGELDERYRASEDHKANLLQLQRMAVMVTNPNNEQSFPGSLTNAFYWGEMIAYRLREAQDEEYWASDSYQIFNQNMVMQYEKYRNTELTQHENLQWVADSLTGALEGVEGDVIADLLDAFIEDWVEQTIKTPADQLYMILGFRHVIAQAELVEDEAESKDGDVLDETLLGEEAGTEVGDEFEMESINDVRERLMEKYATYREAYGEIDMADEEAVQEMATNLMKKLNKDLVRMEGIEPEDFVQISGNAVFVISDEQTVMHGVSVLGKDKMMKGTVEAVSVTDVPTFETIKQLRSPVHSEEVTKPDMNPLGVTLILSNPVFVDSDGEHFSFPDGTYAGLVLNNPDMDIQKYLL